MTDKLELAIKSAWEAATILPYLDPREMRTDSNDAFIAYHAYGNNKSLWGWQLIDNSAMHCQYKK